MPVTDVLLQHGPWGAAVSALGWAVFHLYKRTQHLNDKRVDDHKTLLEQYRMTVEENGKTIDTLARSLEKFRR